MIKIERIPCVLESNQLVFKKKCPFCKRRKHRHGLGNGTRQSHCLKFSGEYYVFAVGGENGN